MERVRYADSRVDRIIIGGKYVQKKHSLMISFGLSSIQACITGAIPNLYNGNTIIKNSIKY